MRWRAAVVSSGVDDPTQKRGERRHHDLSVHSRRARRADHRRVLLRECSSVQERAAGLPHDVSRRAVLRAGRRVGVHRLVFQRTVRAGLPGASQLGTLHQDVVRQPGARIGRPGPDRHERHVVSPLDHDRRAAARAEADLDLFSDEPVHELWLCDGLYLAAQERSRSRDLRRRSTPQPCRGDTGTVAEVS